eukprot:428827-Hanusia_phi.AAC.1
MAVRSLSLVGYAGQTSRTPCESNTIYVDVSSDIRVFNSCMPYLHLSGFQGLSPMTGTRDISASSSHDLVANAATGTWNDGNVLVIDLRPFMNEMYEGYSYGTNFRLSFAVTNPSCGQPGHELSVRVQSNHSEVTTCQYLESA